MQQESTRISYKPLTVRWSAGCQADRVSDECPQAGPIHCIVGVGAKTQSSGRIHHRRIEGQIMLRHAASFRAMSGECLPF